MPCMCGATDCPECGRDQHTWLEYCEWCGRRDVTFGGEAEINGEIVEMCDTCYDLHMDETGGDK